MKQKLSRNYTFHFIFLLFLNIATYLGCHKGISELPQKPQPKTTKTFSSRFGAIRHTFADVYVEPDVKSERLTQCIYGDVVRIEQENLWWYAVKVGPYPGLSGWIHKSMVIQLPSNALYLKERGHTTIVIRQDMSQVFVWPSQTINIVMGTELPFIGESGQWYLVRLPSNDVGRIARDAVHPFASIIAQPLIHSKQVPSPEPLNILEYRRDIITTAQKFLGKVYIWGGTTPRGFDCSGLTYFVYKLHGIELPRVSWLQFRDEIGKQIKKTHLTQGDLVFFQTYKPGPSHVGIYIGNNQFIHASPKYGVTISNLDDPYFRGRYIGAKTVFLSS
jgi:hypothetical protein